MYWVGGFARTRRAYHAAHAAAPGRPDGLLAAVVAQRDRVDRELTQTESPSLLPSGLTPTALRNALGRPAVIMALVCGAPSILYLVIGGFPQTAGIQTVMKGPVVWPLVLLITAVAQARLAWSVIVGVRNWSKTRRLPSGDDAAIVGLQLACGIGAVGLAGFAMIRVFSGVSAGSSLLSGANGADAGGRVSPEDAAAVANTAAAAGEAAADAAEPDGYGTDEGDVANPVIQAETGAASLGSEADAGMDVDAESDAPAEAEAAAAEAEARATQAEADAAQANADALEAQKFHKQAVDVVDSAEIRQGTDGFDDPWDGRKADEMEEDKRAAGVAADGVTEANAKAAEARAAADNARAAADNARYAADRAADPLGAASSDADKNYADAKARETEAFYDTHQDFAAAQKAAALAREQAEAAKAAADAAKDPRTAQVTPWDKP
jgi:hypothetical protein